MGLPQAATLLKGALLVVSATVMMAQPVPQPVPQCGPPPGGPGGMPVNNNQPCGTDALAAVVSYSLDPTQALRVIHANGCPPYDWTDQKSPGPNGTFATARQNPSTLTVPRRPTIQADPSNSLPLARVMGPVGQTLFGPPIFSPYDACGRDALIFEGTTFDHCGGHVAPGPDQYHYHSTPGDANALNHKDSRNLKFQICPELSWWLQMDVSFWHSPLIGIMADGVPLHGPRGDWGQLPQGLDQCSGHTDRTHPYYHYHTTSDFPYAVNCLRGCMDNSIQRGRNWQDVQFPACQPAANQYDYVWLDISLPWRLNGGNDLNGNRKLKLRL